MVGFSHKIDWSCFTNGLFNRYEECSIPTYFLEKFCEYLDWNIISCTSDFLSSDQVIYFNFYLNLDNLMSHWNLHPSVLEYLLQNEKIKLYDILQHVSSSFNITYLTEEVIFEYLMKDIEKFKINITNLFQSYSQSYRMFSTEFLDKILNVLSSQAAEFYPNELQNVLERILSEQSGLTEEIVIKYQKFFTWDSISCYYNSTNEFLYKYENSLKLMKLFTHRKLDNEYWEKSFYKYFTKHASNLLETIIINQRIKEELILEYKDKLDLEIIIECQNLSLDTLISFYNYLIKKNDESGETRRRYNYENVLLIKIDKNKVINSSTKQKFKDFILLIK